MRHSRWEEIDGHEERRVLRPPPEPDLDLDGRHPSALSPETVVALQRTAGNQRVARALSPAGDRALLQRGKGRRGQGGRGKGGGGKRGEGSLADRLATLSNNMFFASHFVDAHVLRQMSPELARTKFRAGKNTSVLFLDGDAFQTLADEVRHFTRAIARKRGKQFAAGGGNATFISQASFHYITIFDNAGQPQPGRLRYGHLVFAVEKRGEVLWQAQTYPLFSINHCEAMDDVKHPDEPWERHSELSASDAADLSDVEEDDDTEDEEEYYDEAEEELV